MKYITGKLYDNVKLAAKYVLPVLSFLSALITALQLLFTDLAQFMSPEVTASLAGIFAVASAIINKLLEISKSNFFEAINNFDVEKAQVVIDMHIAEKLKKGE